MPGPKEPRTTDSMAAKPERPWADGRSFGDLIRELGNDSSRLIRQEIGLAKAEMREKMEQYERSLVKLAIGGVLLLGAAGALLAAANRGLTALLEQFMSVEMAVWIAPLILAVVFGLIGWSMVTAAQRTIKGVSVIPHQTMDTLREEKEWIKREAREARHD